MKGKFGVHPYPNGTAPREVTIKGEQRQEVWCRTCRGRGCNDCHNTGARWEPLPESRRIP